VGAVAVELAALVGFLVVPPVADPLDHAVPPAPALVVALTAAPAVLFADAIHKAHRHPADAVSGVRPAAS
jgi:hypothetical protein